MRRTERLTLRQWSEHVYGAYHTGESAERYGLFLGVVEGDRDSAHAQATALLAVRNGCVATIPDTKIAPAEQPSSTVVWHDVSDPATAKRAGSRRPILEEAGQGV